MKSFLVLVNNGARAGTTTTHLTPGQLGGDTGSATEGHGACPIPYAPGGVSVMVTFSRLTVNGTDPGGANSYTIALLYSQDGGSTWSTSTLAATVNSGSTSGVDNTNSLVLNSGDLWQVKWTASGTGPAVRFSSTCQAVVSDLSMQYIAGGIDAEDTIAASGGIRFSTLIAAENDLGTEADVSLVIPTPGTFHGLSAFSLDGPGGGNTNTVTLRKNGASGGPSAAVSGAGPTTANDSSNSCAVVAFDVVSIGMTFSSGSTHHLGWGTFFIPDTAGYTIHAATDTPSVASQEYWNWVGTGDGNTTEANHLVTFNCESAQTLRDLTVDVDNAPGAAASGNQFEIRSRVNSADGSLTATIFETATQAADNSNTDAIAVGDALDSTSIPTSGPNGGPMRVSYVLATDAASSEVIITGWGW